MRHECFEEVSVTFDKYFFRKKKKIRMLLSPLNRISEVLIHCSCSSCHLTPVEAESRGQDPSRCPPSRLLPPLSQQQPGQKNHKGIAFFSVSSFRVKLPIAGPNCREFAQESWESSYVVCQLHFTPLSCGLYGWKCGCLIREK